MTTTTTITPATDDQIKEYLQGEIQTALQVGGLDWLETTLQAAIEEREETEPLTEEQRETITEARRLISKTAGLLSLRQWDDAIEAAYEISKRLTWLFPGYPASRAMELQRELYAVTDAIEAAIFEPGSRDWNEWDGWDNWATILTDQPYYQPWLSEALDAWHAGDNLTIDDDLLKIIVDDDDPDYED